MYKQFQGAPRHIGDKFAKIQAEREDDETMQKQDEGATDKGYMGIYYDNPQEVGDRM